MSKSGDDMPEDWEDKMLNKLTEMFKQMGMDVNLDTLKNMMEQFQNKFEEMGFDAEKIAKGGVNLNFDLSNLNDMLSKGGNLNDMLSNLGFDVKVDAKPTEIPVPEEGDDDIEQVKQLPAADVYLDGWEMAITVDCTTEVELDEKLIELELIEKGSLLEVMRSTQVAPVARIELPHQCDELVDWSFNNGILDVTLKLTPQGSAIDEENTDDESGDDSDEEVEIPDVSIDLSDDDDEDDGGIPIL